jgi:hypothetical protein
MVWAEDYWIEWTQQHPDIASVLWPLLLRVFRSDVPERSGLAGHVLFLARISNDADEFAQQVQIVRDDPLFPGFSDVLTE